MIISRYVDAIRLAPLASPEVTEVKKLALDQITMLKELTWNYVILNNELATVQYGQTQAVRVVFEILLNAAKASSWKFFPPFYQEELQAASRNLTLVTRTVIDYLAGMTEHEVERLHTILTGTK